MRNVKVDCVQVLSLRRRMDKRMACVGCLRDAGVPADIIHWHPGLDARETPEDQIIELLDIAGYPFYKREKVSWGEICCDYSYVKGLQEIASGRQTTMFIMDDRRLLVPFAELQRELSVLPPFKVCQLECYTRKSGDSYTVTPLAEKSRFSEGLIACGIDSCIYTPDGAQWALRQIAKYPKVTVERALRVDPDFNGLYTAIHPFTAEIGGDGYWDSDVRAE